MKTNKRVTPLPAILGAAVLFLSIGMYPGPASSRKIPAGRVQLKVAGLNPGTPMVPEFTLSLKRTGGLDTLSAMTAGINAEAGAVDRAVLHKDIPGLKSYNPELPAITRSLPAGDYYLYVRMDGFETALEFSVLEEKTTRVQLTLSHIELRVPQCGFYDADSVEFHVCIPYGPPVYRAKVPCDSRRVITLEPGAYEGVVINEDQKRRTILFVVTKGEITPVELSFP